MRYCVFPLANRQLQRPLRHVVLQGCPQDLQKPGQRLPMGEQVLQRFTQTAVGLDRALLELCVQPVLELLHNGAAILLMVPQARLGTHLLDARLFLMVEHLLEGFNDYGTFVRKHLFKLGELASAMGQTVAANQCPFIRSIARERI